MAVTWWGAPANSPSLSDLTLCLARPSLHLKGRVHVPLTTQLCVLSYLSDTGNKINKIPDVLRGRRTGDQACVNPHFPAREEESGEGTHAGVSCRQGVDGQGLA